MSALRYSSGSLVCSGVHLNAVAQESKRKKQRQPAKGGQKR
jgi:hypothetical protein